MHAMVRVSKIRGLQTNSELIPQSMELFLILWKPPTHRRLSYVAPTDPLPVFVNTNAYISS